MASALRRWLPRYLAFARREASGWVGNLDFLHHPAFADVVGEARELVRSAFSEGAVRAMDDPSGNYLDN